MKTLCGFVVGGLAVVIGMVALEARTWTSAKDPSKTIEGELVSSDGTNVEIKLANGQTIKTTLSFFSKADQDFVAAQANPKPGTAPAVATPAPATAAKTAAPPKPEDLEPIQFEIWDIRTCGCANSKQMYEEALSVEGVTIEFDKNNNDKKIIKVDAKTKLAARQALDNIVAAGLYGGTTTRTMDVKPTSAGKAEGNMTATGVKFCCNKSVDAMEAALARARSATDIKEKGVTEHSKLSRGDETFEIKGTARASEILRHARTAGFNFTIEQTAAPAEPEK